jgi:hypothetical protein
VYAVQESLREQEEAATEHSFMFFSDLHLDDDEVRYCPGRLSVSFDHLLISSSFLAITTAQDRR